MAKQAQYLKQFRDLTKEDGTPLLDAEGLYTLDVALRDPATTDPDTLLAKFRAPSADDNDRRFGVHWSQLFYKYAPQYEEERTKRFIEYEMLQNKGFPPVDAVACPRCGVLNQRQGENKLAADEGGITFAVCTQCGLRWTPE